MVKQQRVKLRARVRYARRMWQLQPEVSCRARAVSLALLELAGDFGQDVGYGRTVIRQKIGQSDLAAMTGIARESACRITNDWLRRKIISRSSGYYRIENKEQLQHEAEAELAAY